MSLIDRFTSLLHKFIDSLQPGHFEGIILYCCGTFTMEFVQIYYAKEFQAGLKGENMRWEAPEIAFYLWLRLFPHVVMAVLFLGLNPPLYFWLFFGGIGLWMLTGRYGFDWILALKGKGKTETPPTT
jgi:hypothetical protein